MPDDRAFDAMRQDAIRRAREMQRQARPFPPPPPPAPPRPAPPPARPDRPPHPVPPHPDHPPHPDPPPPAPPPLLPGELSDLLHSLMTGWDGERLALAGLLYLLYREGADPALLLALAYVLL